MTYVMTIDEICMSNADKLVTSFMKVALKENWHHHRILSHARVWIILI